MNTKNVFSYVLIFILSIIFIREPLFLGYNLQILGEPCIPPYTEQIKASHDLNKLFSIWDETNLGYRKLYPTGLFTRILILGFANLGLDGGTIYNLIIVLSLFIAGLGMFLLIQLIINSEEQLSPLIGAIFYMSSPFLFHHILFGHYQTIISYSLAPWIVLFYIKFWLEYC